VNAPGDIYHLELDALGQRPIVSSAVESRSVSSTGADEHLPFERVQESNLGMAISDNSYARRPSPPFKAWTIAILAGFGIFHVVGGCMLHYAPGIRPIETAATAILGD
jgi:hypothetical protein